MTAMLSAFDTAPLITGLPAANRAAAGSRTPTHRRTHLRDVGTRDVHSPNETPEDILQTTVRVTRHLAGVSAAFAAVPRNAGGYCIVACEGLADPRWDGLTILPDRGLGALVLESGTPVLVSDIVDDPALGDFHRALLSAEGLRAVACVPVAGATGIAALLYIAERRVDGLSDQQVEELRRTSTATGLVLATAAQHAAFSRRLDTIAHIARSAAKSTDDAGELRAVLARIGAAADGTPLSADSGIRVTPRERDVLELLAEGASNRMIATRLVLSETTVKGYIHTLLSKFEAGSRLEIVAIARRRGMI